MTGLLIGLFLIDWRTGDRTMFDPSLAALEPDSLIGDSANWDPPLNNVGNFDRVESEEDGILDPEAISLCELGTFASPAVFDANAEKSNAGPGENMETLDFFEDSMGVTGFPGAAVLTRSGIE